MLWDFADWSPNRCLIVITCTTLAVTIIISWPAVNRKHELWMPGAKNHIQQLNIDAWWGNFSHDRPDPFLVDMVVVLPHTDQLSFLYCSILAFWSYTPHKSVAVTICEHALTQIILIAKMFCEVATPWIKLGQLQIVKTTLLSKAYSLLADLQYFSKLIQNR